MLTFSGTETLVCRGGCFDECFIWSSLFWKLSSQKSHRNRLWCQDPIWLLSKVLFSNGSSQCLHFWMKVGEMPFWLCPGTCSLSVLFLLTVSSLSVWPGLSGLSFVSTLSLILSSGLLLSFLLFLSLSSFLSL